MPSRIGIRISAQPNPCDSNRARGGELRWMTQFDGSQNCPSYVALVLRHDFGWSSDHPERRVRFLPQ